MFKQSFTLRVLAISFIILAIPLLVSSFIFFQRSYLESIQDAKNRLKEAASFRGLDISEMQPVKQVLLKELIYLLNLEEGLEGLNQQKLNEELDWIAKYGGDFEILILEPHQKNGRFEIFATSWGEEREKGFTNYEEIFHIQKNGGESFLRYFYSPTQKKYLPYIFVGRPISSKKTGLPVGVILIAASIEKELPRIISPIGAAEDIKFAILNNAGVVFGASDQALLGNHFNALTLQQRERLKLSGAMGDTAIAIDSLPVKEDDPPYFEFTFNGQTQIAYQTKLPRTNITIVAYSTKDKLFAESIRHFFYIYTIFGVILICGSGITYWISRLISRPLRNLSFLMGEVSQGDLNVRFKEEPLGFEINILGKIFNDTVESVLENMQKAEDEHVKKMVYQRELKIGREVQQALLPDFVPEFTGAEMHGIFLQGRTVGGDFYGWRVFKTKESREYLLFGVADAVGEGIPACLYALGIRSLIRTYATCYQTLKEIFTRTNNAFFEDVGETGMFATLIGGIYFTDTKELSYYSFGHPPAIVRRTNGVLETLAQSGAALGVIESKGIQPDLVQLFSGDILLIYTNGLLNLSNKDGKRFGIEGVKRTFSRQRWENAEEVLNVFKEEIRLFSENEEQEEEIAIVVLKIF